MRRARAAGLVTLCLTVVASASALLAHARSAPQQPSFRATSNAVRVDVTVQQRGRPVTDLKLQDFEILDNGTPQVVTDMSYEKLPIDVTVAAKLYRESY